MNRKIKILCFTLFIVTIGVLYVEIISYNVKAQSLWAKFPTHAIKGEIVEPLRILIVGDPQIQGEHDEPPIFGIFTRWDSDRYLQRTYALAKKYVQPHVVLFMGDLFDEGSKAEDSEYRRYFARFQTIFDLPKKNYPSEITHIFLPGDNDVGGEGLESVSSIKSKWFIQTFGDYKKPVNTKVGNSDLQFVQFHGILPEYSKGPFYGLESVAKEKSPNFRILLSHASMLSFRTESVDSVIDLLNPSMIISAHNHRSMYFKLEPGSRNSKHLSGVKNFLSAKAGTSFSQDGNTISAVPFTKYFPFSLNQVPNEDTLHEINVPTCSYRMGVTEMGYGYLEIYPDGAASFTILWSPSRFQQLLIYLVFIILLKISAITYLMLKIFKFLFKKFQQFRVCRQKHNHSV